MKKEKRIKELIKICIILSLFCVFLVIIDISTTVILHNKENDNSNKIRQNSFTIKEGEFRLCERLNTVRHQSNNAHWVQWLQLKQSVLRSKELAKKETKTASIRLKGAKESEVLSEKLTWTKLTNCNEAVSRPKTYHAPKPSKFNKYNLKSPPIDEPW